MQIEDRNPIIRINEILILISRRDEYTNLYYIFDYIALETRGYEILRILKSIPGAINRFSSRNRITDAPRRSVVIIYMEKKERKDVDQQGIIRGQPTNEMRVKIYARVDEGNYVTCLQQAFTMGD